jgi:hypothetical protein
MGAHFANAVPRSRPGRRRQAGLLAIALGVGLLAFAFLEEDGTPVRSTSPTVPPSSEPTVLGVTVDPGPTAPDADPAAPVPVAASDDEDDDPSGPGSPSTAGGPATTRPSTTTTEGAVLIPPTVVTNTAPTTTTSAPSSTSTTETTTTTTEAPTNSTSTGTG